MDVARKNTKTSYSDTFHKNYTTFENACYAEKLKEKIVEYHVDAALYMYDEKYTEKYRNILSILNLTVVGLFLCLLITE